MRALLMLSALLLPALAVAQPRPVPTEKRSEDIGSWMLTCESDPMTDRGDCTMRHKLWVEVPREGTPGIALEVISRFGQLVPALTVRELTLESIPRGFMALTATAQMRFDRNPMLELPCGFEGLAVVCAPSQQDAQRAASQLAAARTVLVRIRGIGPLPTEGPTEPVALDLDGTQQALARFRPEAKDSPPQPAARDWRQMLERLMELGGGAARDSAPAQ